MKPELRGGVTGFAGHPTDQNTTALARCIGVDAGSFARIYWGRMPLLTPGAQSAPFDRSTSGDRAGERTGFDDLFSASAVDELVSERGLRTPFIRMANQGNVLPAGRFTRSGGSGAAIADQVADDKVLGELAAGATLVLQALHRTWPPLIRFTSELAAELGHPVQVNAYITPPQNQGFAAHYDTHDVFVLQVAGTKRWLVHEPVLRSPLPTQAWEQRRAAVAARAAEPPLMETVLRPGDALYLPRGYLHSAAALGELSIHLTVGVHPVTRNALLRELIDASADDPTLRQSLPMGSDLTDPEVLAPELAATAAALADFAAGIDEAHVGPVAARLAASLATATRPEPVAPLAQSAAVAGLHTGTVLRARAGLRFRVTERGEQITISYLDKSLTMPSAAADSLAVALTAASFVPRELPGLDADEQLVLARRLLREALVVPVDGGSSR